MLQETLESGRIKTRHNEVLYLVEGIWGPPPHVPKYSIVEKPLKLQATVVTPKAGDAAFTPPILTAFQPITHHHSRGPQGCIADARGNPENPVFHQQYHT